MLLTVLVSWYAAGTLLICSCSEISVVRLSPQPIPAIDADICLTRCIGGYPICMTCCWMVFRSFWTPIARHQASNLIRPMHNAVLNHICSFHGIPQIALCGWFTMQSVSVLLLVVASVSASDRWAWNSTPSLGAIFPAPYSSSSAAVVIWACLLATVHLGPVSLVPTSWNRCCPWCWLTIPQSLCLTGVTWWISHSNCSLPSANQHLTIRLPLVALYSGAPEIAFSLL